METNISTISYKNLTWYDVVDPTAEDLAELVQKYKFHELDVEDCLTENQRPKIDEYDNYFFIVLHFPVFNRNTKRVRTSEIDLFIGQNFIVTVHEGDLDAVNAIRERCGTDEGRAEFLGRGSGYFLYELTSRLFDNCFPIIDSFWRKISSIEKDVFDSGETRDLLQDIMTLKRNVIAFRRILQPERPVIASLEHKNKKFLPDELEVYFDDVVDKVEQLWTSLESIKEVSDTLQNANESFISHTTGNTIKVLTIFSVIAVPFTLINNIFSMNVWFPEAIHASPIAFFVIVGVMFGLAASFVFFLRWKKWL